MVPLADFVNHDSRVDIQYEIFVKDKNFVGVSVDNKDLPIKSCLDYKDFNPEIERNVKQIKPWISTENCIQRLENSDIWECGYISSDHSEDDDEQSDEEESESEEEEVKQIHSDIECLSLSKEEKKYMSQMSDLEKKQMREAEREIALPSKFSWFHHSDKNSYFVMGTKTGCKQGD